jgi:hypothetical protein
MLLEDPETRLSAAGVLNFIEEEFMGHNDVEDDEDNFSMISSYLTESRNDKTVCSFLLSQGPVYEDDESMKASRESLLG